MKFLVDANRILQVSTHEQRSGKEAQVEVKPPIGSPIEQVEAMVSEELDMAGVRTSRRGR